MLLPDFREPVSSWTHCLWMILSLPGALLLLRASRGEWLKQLALLVYSVSLIICYAGSTLYHGVPESLVGRFETIDYIGIYLMIAGTVTPVALVLLRGRWRWGLLTAIWLFAAIGISLRVAGVPISRLANTCIYLGMGWTGILGFYEMARLLPLRAFRPLFAGGVLYSSGALLNQAQWPVLWPGVFAAHELFHLFVMGGSMCHFWFMLRVVAPFQPPCCAAACRAVSSPCARPRPQPCSCRTHPAFAE